LPISSRRTIERKSRSRRAAWSLRAPRCGALQAKAGGFVGVGTRQFGALLAAPAADAVLADCDGLDVSDDEGLLAPDLFCPGLRNIGTFEGAAMLAAPHPLLLHDVGDKFPTDAIRATYRALGASKRLRIESRKLSDNEIVEWISKLK